MRDLLESRASGVQHWARYTEPEGDEVGRKIKVGSRFKLCLSRRFVERLALD